MLRSSLVIVAASLLALSVSSFVAHGDPTSSVAVSAKAVDSPDSRNEGDDALDSAVAAAVIGTATTEFGEDQVVVKLDTIEVHPASLRDRSVTGEGRLRLGNDPEWISFSFDALYDTATTNVTYPRLHLSGSDMVSSLIDKNAALASSLTAAANQRVRNEFSEQPVKLTLERVIQHPSGSRYMQLEGFGIADFGKEGNTVAQVAGLYDQQKQRWVSVRYELGGSADRVDSNALASR